MKGRMNPLNLDPDLTHPPLSFLAPPPALPRETFHFTATGALPVEGGRVMGSGPPPTPLRPKRAERGVRAPLLGAELGAGRPSSSSGAGRK